jgi:hypothetical protein
MYFDLKTLVTLAYAPTMAKCRNSGLNPAPTQNDSGGFFVSDNSLTL